MYSHNEKLTSKDLITLAIFSVIFSLVSFACVMLLGMVPPTYPFAVAIALIPCGVVWMYMRAKVPKKGSILIHTAIFTLLMFLSGCTWVIALGIVVGGVLAEVITSSGNYRSYPKTVAAYVVFGLCLDLGSFGPIIFMPEYYYNFCIQNGMEVSYMKQLLDILNGPMLIVTLALTVAGALLGAYLGKRAMTKHFSRAGIA